MRKLYTVATNREILGLGGITGPLTEPTHISFEAVLEMVRLGYKIYQVNPYDYTEKVRVSVDNIRNIQFKHSRSQAATQRKLNREIQEMNKPMIVNTVNKAVNEQKSEVPKNSNNQNKPKNNDTKKQSEKISENAVVKPDAFTK